MIYKEELTRSWWGTLIVDVGGTLLKRARPGAYTRARDWCYCQIGPLDPSALLAVARAVLTAYSPNRAATLVSQELGLTEAAANELRVLLEESDGIAYIEPGARELLLRARELGWRVLAATNAVAWADPLPPDLVQCLDGIFSSFEVGLIKQDPAFWFEFSARVGLEPASSLVIGNNVEADVISPRAAGMAAIHVNPTHLSLTTVLELMEELGEPPSGTIGLLAGQVSEWGGHPVLPADNLRSSVKDVTRASVSFCTRSVQIPGTIIRRSAEPPVACLRGAKLSTSLPSLSWVVASPDRRMTTVPIELDAALTSAGLNLSGIDDRTKRHLISFVVEAQEPQIRKARITEIINFLSNGGKP